MKIEIRYLIDGDRATYSYSVGQDTQTCESKLSTSALYLFCQVLASMQTAWKSEITDYKQKVLIQEVAEKLFKEQHEAKK